MNPSVSKRIRTKHLLLYRYYLNSILDFDWKQDILLPKYIRSGMHLCEEVQTQEHILYNFFKTVFEEEKSPIKDAKIEHFEKFYGPEVASIFKNQVAKKKWYNRATEESLKMWARRDRLNIVSQQMLIDKCQVIRYDFT